MRRSSDKSLKLSDFKPQYLLQWLGFGIWYGLAQLPYPLLKCLAWLLSKMLLVLGIKRFKIIQTNIALCFPHLDAKQQLQLAKKSVYRTLLALFETGALRSRPHWLMLSRLQYENEHYLQQALAQKKGVILLLSHFNYLEFSFLMGSRYEHYSVYRQHKNPVHDKIQWHSRLRYLKKNHPPEKSRKMLIERRNVRQMMHVLQNKKILSISPDQDFGKRNTVFVPFMGVPAATAVSVSKMAKSTGAVVVPLQIYINKKFRITLQFAPPLQNFPSTDLVANCTLLNTIVAEQISRDPSGYMWSHRRFKTQPEGQTNPYLKHTTKC